MECGGNVITPAGECSLFDKLLQATREMPILPRLWLTFIFCNVVLWNVSYAQYATISYTVSKLRAKMISMTRELVLDACQKVDAIQSYRREYGRAEIFQMGAMMHYMRSTFMKMTKVYQLTDELYVTSYNWSIYLTNLQSLVLKASMVDTMLSIIKEDTLKKETKAMMHERMNRVLRSGQQRERARVLRSGKQRARASPGAAGAGAPKRKNQKWRRVDTDFA